MPRKPQTSPSRRDIRTALMARQMVAIDADRGVCTEQDLFDAGFDRAEVSAWSDDARAQASALKRAAERQARAA